MIKVGDIVFKTKINYLKNEKANAISVLQSQDSVVIEVVRGKNQLKFESVSNYFKSTKENSEYFVDLLFSYKKICSIQLLMKVIGVQHVRE